MLLLPSLSSSQTIALTFDDGPNMADSVALSPADRNADLMIERGLHEGSQPFM